MTGAFVPGHVEIKPGALFGAAWEALAHDCGCAVLLLDAQLRIVSVNRDACALYDQSEASLLGRGYGDLLAALGQGHRTASLDRVLATGKTAVIRYVLNRQARTVTYRATRHAELPGGRGVLVTCRDDAASEMVDPSADLLDERNSGSNPLSGLTARERQVLECIAEGFSSAEIAKKLHRSVKTVEGHRARLGYKLGARNRSELTRLAIALGLVKAGRSPAKVAPARG